MAHYRCTALGTLPGEVFNFGIHANGAGGSAIAVGTAWSTALSDLFDDPTVGIAQLFTAQIEIVGFHVAELDALTGKQIDASAGTLALPGSASGETLPNEVACAVTTRGAAPVKKQRGRFFLPPLAVSKMASGRFAATAVTRIANAAALMINDMQGSGFAPEIYHPDHTGTPIVEVDVGDVPDAQRRRRDKQMEVRVSVGV